MRYIVKRDGRKEEYNFGKIRCAVQKAFNSCNQETPEKFLEQLEEEFSKKSEEENLTIDEIQNTIQRFLIKKNKYEVAESFILYRDKRNRAREQKSKLVRGIREKLEAKDIQNQNANVDEVSFGGRMGEASRVATKQLALDSYMTEMARNNHLSNRIYIHDLDSYAVGMHNCLTIPFDDLLAKGFKTRQTDVRPANSINTAMQLLAVIFQLQSLQQFGGVSASHLDWTMVPYIRKSFMKHFIVAYLKDSEEFKDLNLIEMVFENYEEKVDLGVGYRVSVNRNRFDDWTDKHKKDCLGKIGLTVEDFYLENKKLQEGNLHKYYQSALYDTLTETKQAVEGMYHNLNTLQSRSGNQLPFTSINYGTCTQLEGRIVTEAILRISIEGLGALHKTPIFPCGIFQCMKGVNRNEGEPNYDLYKLALRSTSQRLYPNYANVDWSGNVGYDKNDPCTYFSTMGCRTANGLDINGLGQRKDGRGNICPVTIILPTVAMEAKAKCIKSYGEDYTKEDLITCFMEYLDEMISQAKDMLIERFNWICKQPMESAKFMYENNTMAGYDGVNTSSALKHGTLSLGQLGLAECLQILIGCDHTTDEGMELGNKIEQLFSKRCNEYKEKYKLNFGVYYTPAENLCYTALKKFRATYGVIPNVSDRDYFTNSMHVPVWHEMSPFEKIDIESKLTGYSRAGCITYIELPSTCKNNLDALETFVNYAMDKDIPYFAINVPNDTCQECGYTDELNNICPICGSSNIERLRRVTGYLTGHYLSAFNLGKQAEVKDRVKHVKEF